MLPLRAEIHSDAPVLDQRSAARRILKLEVSGKSSTATAAAIIHNLSEEGLLLETSVDLQVGEALQVELPHVGSTRALVVWNRGEFIGCEFFSPISKAAVSAALLRSPAQFRPQSVLSLPPARGGSEQSPIDDRSFAEQAALLFSLIVSLMVALALVIAMLSFPFST